MITNLPKVGTITEKNLSTFWYRAMPYDITTGLVLAPVAAGLEYGLYDVISGAGTASIMGYAVTGIEAAPSTPTLTVTLAPYAKSYVYLVLDMAGGGTNTIGPRLVAYTAPAYVPYSVLVASVITNGTTGTELEYLWNRSGPDLMGYTALQYGAGNTWILAANTGRTTSSTDEVLVKQFCVKYGGVCDFSVKMKRTTTGTATCNVYCAGTGTTAQLTFTTTSSTYETNTGTLTVTPGDTVSVYHKMSSASGTSYVSTCSVSGVYGTPRAPALLLE